jgi:hypothetical protein
VSDVDADSIPAAEWRRGRERTIGVQWKYEAEDKSGANGLSDLEWRAKTKYHTFQRGTHGPHELAHHPELIRYAEEPKTSVDPSLDCEEMSAQEFAKLRAKLRNGY